MEDFRILYKTYVISHMEYAAQAWSPYMVKDIQVLEKVQQRANKCVTSLKNKTYQQRLKIWVFLLWNQRKRGDLIETYKILTGKEDIDRHQLFQLTPNTHSTRGHQLKVFKKPCRINVHKIFFSQRVVVSWTSTRSRTDWMTTSLEMDAYNALLFKSVIYKLTSSKLSKLICCTMKSQVGPIMYTVASNTSVLFLVFIGLHQDVQITFYEDVNELVFTVCCHADKFLMSDRPLPIQLIGPITQ